jgi:putative ABC transport system substrate-binding protein
MRLIGQRTSSTSRRRLLRFGLAAMALVASRAAGAQASGARRVAWFGGTGVPKQWQETFRNRLAELGFVDGRNLTLRLFTARLGKDADARRDAATAMLKWNPAVIVSSTASGIRSIADMEKATPIVFFQVADPVASGLVASLHRPGANITGITTHYVSLAVKRLDLAHELLPRARRIAIVYDTTWIEETPTLLAQLGTAASRLSLELVPVAIARGPDGLSRILAGLNEARGEAVLPITPLYVEGDFAASTRVLVDHQARSRAPWIDDTLESVEDGFFMALGESQMDHMRRVAEVTARVLKGARPSTLPVDEPTRIQIWVNGRTADLVGIRVPPSILSRADRVVS